ncbi:MAG: phosphotransferase family protein, partial [Actinomycetota bacterium]
GHSNETFFISRGPHEWVLRRPPLAVYLPTAHDVLREFRILLALDATAVRVPHVVLACEDTAVIGAAFYLMEKVDGVVIRDQVPQALENEGIGPELITALAELHQVDPLLVGGKPTGYLQRQVKRWSGQLELATSLTTQSREIPDMWKVRDWLGEHMPTSGDPAIVHGDYKLDNTMFAPSAPTRLLAILDWEMSTVGDPLADLGWLLSFWHEPSDPPDPLHDALPRLPQSRAELIALYEHLTGRVASDMRWYVVLAIWKLGCLLEGSFGRHLLGSTDDPFFARLETGVPALARSALDVAAGSLDI